MTLSNSFLGMSYERLSPNDLDKAFLAYAAVIPLVTAVVNEFQGSFSAPGNTLVTTFPKYRELWRWVERSLRRAIVIAARLHDLHGQGEDSYSLWTLFDLYRACSAHWPPTFRPYLRSWVATIHSRAFVLRARIVPPGILKTKAPRWIISARSVLQEFRSLLNVCTHFPRAGERNVLVEDFVDLCVAVWEADGAVGEQAGWVIDVSVFFITILSVVVLTLQSSYSGGRLALLSTPSGYIVTCLVCSPRPAIATLL